VQTAMQTAESEGHEEETGIAAVEQVRSRLTEDLGGRTVGEAQSSPDQIAPEVSLSFQQ
jgi:hypothetical protein